MPTPLRSDTDMPTALRSDKDDRVLRCHSLQRSIDSSHASLPSMEDALEGSLSETCDIMYVVQHNVLGVQKTTLVSTRFGSYLQRRGWMNRALLLAVLVAAVIFFIPFSEGVYEVYDSNGDLKTLERIPALQSVMGSLGVLFALFLVAHQMNRQIFVRTVFSFDFMVIVGSGFMIQAVWFCNWYLVFVRFGEWNWEDIPLRALELISAMCFYVAIAAMDSVTMRYTRRLMLCSILVVSFLAEFVIARFKLRYGNFFADEDLDWWLIGTTPDEIYLSSKLQMLLFLGKATFAYAHGHPFSCIKAEYSVPGRDVLVGRVVRQLSDSMSLTRIQKSSSGLEFSSAAVASNGSKSFIRGALDDTFTDSLTGLASVADEEDEEDGEQEEKDEEADAVGIHLHPASEVPDDRADKGDGSLVSACSVTSVTREDHSEEIDDEEVIEVKVSDGKAATIRQAHGATPGVAMINIHDVVADAAVAQVSSTSEPKLLAHPGQSPLRELSSH